MSVPIEYKGQSVDAALRIDIVVEELVVVELKAVESLLAVHEAQLLTYMKLSKKRVDLLINFNVDLLKNGMVRQVLRKERLSLPSPCPP